MNLQEHFSEELKKIEEMPQRERDFFVTLMLKNFLAVSIAPVAGDPRMLGDLMLMLNAEFTELGYEIQKMSPERLEEKRKIGEALKAAEHKEKGNDEQ